MEERKPTRAERRHQERQDRKRQKDRSFFERLVRRATRTKILIAEEILGAVIIGGLTLLGVQECNKSQSSSKPTPELIAAKPKQLNTDRSLLAERLAVIDQEIDKNPNSAYNFVPEIGNMALELFTDALSIDPATLKSRISYETAEQFKDSFNNDWSCPAVIQPNSLNHFFDYAKTDGNIIYINVPFHLNPAFRQVDGSTHSGLSLLRSSIEGLHIITPPVLQFKESPFRSSSSVPRQVQPLKRRGLMEFAPLRERSTNNGVCFELLDQIANLVVAKDSSNRIIRGANINFLIQEGPIDNFTENYQNNVTYPWFPGEGYKLLLSKLLTSDTPGFFQTIGARTFNQGGSQAEEIGRQFFYKMIQQLP